MDAIITECKIKVHLFHVLDVEGPSFPDSECPNDIIVLIDAANNTAMVNWALPKGNDNSGEPPIIIEENGFVPPMRFDAGNHYVKYSINDNAGNVGSSCIFHVTVEC
ncbi:hypothetical protein DPMN_158418 [Dreissena polymorpha]|uniref:HYR domain-containing protein n=1 Tax=Dreissena polymorpha TaxID=45954 RepID=A0A9D4EM98_DREPO|nr:hypothetical protein DPMN_158418 [Dreissena polymorpha]